MTQGEILLAIIGAAANVMLGGLWSEMRMLTREFRAVKAWAHHKGFRLDEWA